MVDLLIGCFMFKIFYLLNFQLREYPEAVKMSKRLFLIIYYGCKTIFQSSDLLREDNLCDEYALGEQESAEKMTEELQSFVRIQQMGFEN